MAGPPPTPDFSSVALDITTIAVGRTFGRIHRRAYPEPLGHGKNSSRFSDPRRRMPENRFGVLYLGATLKVCFVETLVRDQRDGLVGALDMPETDLDDRLYSEIRVKQQLRLIDLQGDGPVRMGVPTDVVRGRTQTRARQWSLAIHEHPASVDGILYPSRLNNEVNLAVYDRALLKLEAVHSVDLKHAAGLGAILTTYKVGFTDALGRPVS